MAADSIGYLDGSQTAERVTKTMLNMGCSHRDYFSQPVIKTMFDAVTFAEIVSSA